MTAESVPLNALAPLLSGTKIARPAVTVVFLGMPGCAITVVCAATLVDMLENCAAALQDELEGQLCMMSAAGWPKLVLTYAVTYPFCLAGSPPWTNRL